MLYFDHPEVSRLQVLLEEVTRAKPGSPESRFVRPDETLIDRLGSRFHHVVYGRRGSGKSSLLRHIQAERRAQGRLAAWVDYEILMNLSFPDVLVSTLEVVFSDFAAQIAETGVEVPPMPERKRRLRKWEEGLRSNPKAALLHDLAAVAAQLGALKNSPDTADVTWTASRSDTFSLAKLGEAGGSLQANGAGASLKRKRETASSTESKSAITASYSARKEEHLERVLPLYRALVLRLTSLFPDAFVILDELYRLRSSDQPEVVGYLHRVVKDTGVWLKIGSLKYGTTLYKAGPPAVGLQAPHDIKVLSLDRGLLDFKTSKRFLETILAALSEETGVDVSLLLSDGALDRLVLASGGVPRDYIAILSESIAVARNRGPSEKAGSHRVIAEDVNFGAGRTVDAKFDDLDQHAGARSGDLRAMVIELTEHCRATGSACFLVDVQDSGLAASADILQNMRFAHTIDTNESLPDSQSSRYNVFLFDVSQLAAQRALQVDFMGWTKRERRRSRKLVFRPKESRSATAAPSDKSVAPTAEMSQLSFDDADAVVVTVEPGASEPSQ